MTGIQVDFSPFCPLTKEARVCPQRASAVRDCGYCRFNPNAQIRGG